MLKGPFPRKAAALESVFWALLHNLNPSPQQNSPVTSCSLQHLGSTFTQSRQPRCPSDREGWNQLYSPSHSSSPQKARCRTPSKSSCTARTWTHPAEQADPQVKGNQNTITPLTSPDSHLTYQNYNVSHELPQSSADEKAVIPLLDLTEIGLSHVSVITLHNIFAQKGARAKACWFNS